MARHLFLLASVLVACAVPADGVDERPARARQAIVGGAVNPGDPAVVELVIDGEGDCTAAIIAPRVALTAAHCVLEAPAGATFAIFTGPDDSDRNGGELVPVAEVHAHPDYDPDDDTADIAVAILARPVTIAPLPYRRTALDRALVGAPVRMIGYGDNTVKEPTEGFGIKRQATSPLIDFDEDWLYVGTETVNQCYGDSGGPILMTIEGVETIVGVNSWGENDDCNAFNGNSRVDTFAAFVDAQVAAAPVEAIPAETRSTGSIGESALPPPVVASAGCSLAHGRSPTSTAVFAAIALSFAFSASRRTARGSRSPSAA